MPTDKEMKKDFKIKASKDPDKYYAVSVLKQEGFRRGKCQKCGTSFWSVDPDQKVCGDPACSGGFRFFGKKVAKKDLDYIGVWKEFSGIFSKLGYTPIDRYPVAARWRDDTDFVQASIYDFQPYVVSGEVKPPANPLVVPQFSLRFNDIDNVGITGAHYTGFVMIGQHAFMPPEKWNQQKYFSDIHTWLRKGLGLPNEEITYHEDAWTGGGNIGPCMEFFSRGLELGNQVYMTHAIKQGKLEELKLKVLDMGMGHERNAWFCKGSSTSYETTFPAVCSRLYKAAGIKTDSRMMQKFLPYSSYLNIDEAEDINKTWQFVAKQTGYKADELKNNILPLSALYSIAEHTRSLLVALSDGVLPSNVGGGYNLRVILRRALGFIGQYGWNLQLPEIARWHAEYLKPLFPELMEHLDEVTEILEVEKEKYSATRQKSRQIVVSLLRKDGAGKEKYEKTEKIDEKKLLELYDSNGISPELIREEAKKLGKDIKIPDNFYALVAGLHEKAEQYSATKKSEELDIGKSEETKAEYFEDYTKDSFRSVILSMSSGWKHEGKDIPKAGWIILKNTLFYPTSGGQIHDTGILKSEKGSANVINAIKQGSVIVHVVDDISKFKPGQETEGRIDMQRRKQLTQHHTATHIVNAAARKVLGSHINQAGAKKSVERAHLDITHFKSLTEEEIHKIEDEANKIVKQDIGTRLKFMSRDEAEKKFGMGIYQGGAVPGKELRIVEIPGVDIECCGGTHLRSTGEIGRIKIIKASKIQDGIVRLEFTAGKAAEQEECAEKSVLECLANILKCSKTQLPSRAKELFEKWKAAVKKNKDIDTDELTSREESKGDDSEILAAVSGIFKTQPEHLVRTAERFLKELKEKVKK